jgi:hypothetical protein
MIHSLDAYPGLMDINNTPIVGWAGSVTTVVELS